MKNKKLSDYEKLFLEKIEDKTIKELLHDHRSSKYANRYHDENTIVELKDLLDGLEREFFKFALKEKGFLDLPILAARYGFCYDDDYGVYSLLIEKTSTKYYTSVDFDRFNQEFSISLSLFPQPDEIINMGCNTIGDFVNEHLF